MCALKCRINGFVISNMHFIPEKVLFYLSRISKNKFIIPFSIINIIGINPIFLIFLTCKTENEKIFIFILCLVDKGNIYSPIIV